MALESPDAGSMVVPELPCSERIVSIFCTSLLMGMPCRLAISFKLSQKCPSSEMLVLCPDIVIDRLIWLDKFRRPLVMKDRSFVPAGQSRRTQPPSQTLN